MAPEKPRQKARTFLVVSLAQSLRLCASQQSFQSRRSAQTSTCIWRSTQPATLLGLSWALCILLLHLFLLFLSIAVLPSHSNDTGWTGLLSTVIIC